MKVKLNNIVNKSVIIFADIEACGNIVEQVAYSLFLTDITAIFEKRVFNSLFVIDNYAFSRFIISNILIFLHQSASCPNLKLGFCKIITQFYV